ncbi:hypothetical protein PHYSODRAFT_286467 [Phytophthora sojae]|uniref:RxLR effector protein n=1 Tax=Phytophthora sojae (strain P6497) TaxID=1094619 RepID=G4ZLG4_PHYSP|nr:hypothetical protein PHYSODRAFT_286467 [Phytophthora sojae]EGZ16246.1 hypothetical protein PHYSODRAFT_286467 [Phytophthora sojae]|eukprot:XP_009529995.1 hypothetical protein PHYSODRAFT_286467 [Phytophthora sojae]
MKVSYTVLVVIAVALLAALPSSSAEVRQQVATSEMKWVHLRRALHESATIVDASAEVEDAEGESADSDADSVAEEEQEFDEAEKEDKTTQAPPTSDASSDLVSEEEEEFNDDDECTDCVIGRSRRGRTRRRRE